jgi:predicted nucleic acid-binding protein
MKKYALDSNILTYYLKGNENLIVKIDSGAENDNIIIPPMVYYEIKKWLLTINSKTKLAAFEKIIFDYGIDTIDREMFDVSLSIYIRLRKNGIIIGDADILIAAYCLKNDYILVTNNEKHFENSERFMMTEIFIVGLSLR